MTIAESSDNSLTMYNFSNLTMETAQLGKKPNQITKTTPTPQKTQNHTLVSAGLKEIKF